MAFCPKCGAQVEDGAPFCGNCGTNMGAPMNNAAPGVAPMPAMAPAYDPFDHTTEFDPMDVSNNKCYAILPYLLGVIGMIVCALLSKESPFIQFHLRQAVKYTVVNMLLGICCVVLCWTIIVPIAGAVCFIILGILKIITVFQIFAGQSKEPAIIRSLGFLK
ncbi:MAG: zinc-ribbon domain-containing protein [Lachnospiraceae bacterium]|nr:zinc-ribbon domain-containing protein [Lachnospiraceae bacterium]